ncbi:hypothetical protein C5167_033040 [Papaver somniferum]|uniref:Uncharacterized protein n=1 Tax=Papaver somniferum TaxID=3469 RepID=A0A4Y7K985_PAPSO|nr:hypothetical protein C5167_033040 [Papaver somniferum]
MFPSLNLEIVRALARGGKLFSLVFISAADTSQVAKSIDSGFFPDCTILSGAEALKPEYVVFFFDGYIDLDAYDTLAMKLKGEGRCYISA